MSQCQSSLIRCSFVFVSSSYLFVYVCVLLCVPRFVKMMFRLNFLVLFVCLTLNREYVQYYVCPLHTFFFLCVHVVMWLGHKHNEKRWFLAMKLAGMLVLLVLIFDVPSLGLFQVTYACTCASCITKHTLTCVLHSTATVAACTVMMLYLTRVRYMLCCCVGFALFSPFPCCMPVVLSLSCYSHGSRSCTER